MKIKHVTLAWLFILIFWFSGPAASLTLEIENPSVEQARLLSILKDSRLLDRFSSFVESNFKLEHEITLSFKEGKTPFYDSDSAALVLPYTYMSGIYETLTVKYPSQPDVVQRIFVSSVAHALWHQLAHALVEQFHLPILGYREDAIDNFTMLVMLTQRESALDDQDFILDAAETFLAHDRERQILDERSSSELQSANNRRYDTMVCLVLGKDYQPYDEVLKELSWSQARLKWCQEEYLRQKRAWSAILTPYLKKGSVILSWAKASQELHKPPQFGSDDTVLK